jgi:hypothetical protein
LAQKPREGEDGGMARDDPVCSMTKQVFRCPHFSPAVAISTENYQQLLAPRHEVVAITVYFSPEKASVENPTPSLAATSPQLPTSQLEQRLERNCVERYMVTQERLGP